MKCYICHSSKFIDNHHLDCHEGRYSPETVPLCRRCHRTLHDWGIGAFSPDTTKKALEVENKRREIFGLPPMKLEDVTHSAYWYKKHHIRSPATIRQKKVLNKIGHPAPISQEGAFKAVPFRIPTNPLCGVAWLEQHLDDYTPEQIASLTIEVSYNGQHLATASLTDKKRTIRNIVRNKEVKGGRNI